MPQADPSPHGPGMAASPLGKAQPRAAVSPGSLQGTNGSCQQVALGWIRTASCQSFPLPRWKQRLPAEALPGVWLLPPAWEVPGWDTEPGTAWLGSEGGLPRLLLSGSD